MDHYQTLGVAKNATPDEVKKAYRKLASQHHPDKGGDTNTFQQIQTAYDTLSDPIKRQQYDNPTIHPGTHGFHFNFNGQNIHDIFEQFGGMHNIFRQNHGPQTFRTRVQVTLIEAYYGLKKTLQLQTNNGPFVANIDIPKGVNNGQQIRYENIIPNAHLLIEFIVAPDLTFDRQGNDLYINLPINIFDLVIGKKVFVKTIDKKDIEVHIRPLTQPYMQLKLVGKGMPIFNSNMYGDQILLLKPFIPDNIHEEITDILHKHQN